MSENRLQVLLVEDNAADARLIREVLADAELGHAAAMPFRLLTADRLATGLARLAENGADVVLLDLSLPDSQGLNTLVSLIAQAPAVPIVVLTGLDDEAVAARALQEGAQDYLVKGQLDINLLARTLRYAIERKRAEEALRESERQLSLVYSNVSDIIFYLAVEPDDRFRFVSINPAFLKATGLPQSQVVGKLVQEVIPEPAHALVFGNYKEAIRDKKTVAWEEVSVYPAGTKHGEVSVTPIFDANGHCTNLIGTVHDITERKQVEEEIRRLNEELEQRVAERTAELGAVNRELEAFSYSVAHDLRAPLRHIGGYVELLQEAASPALDEASRRYLTKIADSVKRMGTLIDDLLTFSRMGRAEMHRAVVNLEALVKEALHEVQADTQGRDIAWQIDPLPAVYGDRAMLRLVLVNLISNALKFTRPRARAEIEIGRLADHADEIVVFIRDNGVGFDMQYADKLFGVFQRLHSQHDFDGTGIGLANARRIIHRHGGRIWAEGAVDGGATFYVSLPKAPGVNP